MPRAYGCTDQDQITVGAASGRELNQSRPEAAPTQDTERHAYSLSLRERVGVRVEKVARFKKRPHSVSLPEGERMITDTSSLFSKSIHKDKAPQPTRLWGLFH